MKEFSKRELLQRLPLKQKEAFLKSLKPEVALQLQYDPKFVLRPSQQPPSSDNRVVLYCCGRAWGKTRTGSSIIHKWAMENPGCRIAIIGATAADIRDTVINGESGIMNCVHPAERPDYIQTNRLLKWKNGSQAITYSGETPELLRGAQADFALIDELAKMPKQEEIWEQLTFIMRLNAKPQIVVTTTPKPTRLIKKLASDPKTHLVIGSTYDNGSLPDAFVQDIKDKYEGTRIGRQEIYAEILEDNENSLFSRNNIDDTRILKSDWVDTDLIRTIVAIDPATTDNANSDETGIIVGGMNQAKHGFIIADKSLQGSPNKWAQKAVQAYYTFQANYIVAEVNQGGDMVENMIKNIDPNIKVKKVRATKGKAVRAEPVAALYEQNRVHHIGTFDELEDQCCNYDPLLGRNQKSPDRMDALVWCLTDLLVSTGPTIRLW